MDLIAAQDPVGAVPLFELDSTLFPGLEVQFFTTPNGDLVPVQRGIIRKPVKDRTESFWEIIVGPGKVWKDNKNKEQRWKGWNKAAFPFSLVQSQEGEALLGLAFFYFKGHEVSKLYFQVSNDTAGGFIFWDVDFNMKAWGEIDIAFTPNTIPNLKELRKAFKNEVSNRYQMRPLSELGDDVSGMGGDVNQDNVLTIAMVKDSTIYHSPINTPFGEYPYPHGMRVGVWSASKSLIPGMAALRLAQKYGTDFLDTKIVDYFEEGDEFEYVSVEAEARWKMVTIWHALHMTTGMGPAGYDPNWAWDSVNTYLWSYSYDFADQIRYYFNQGPNPFVGGPGEAFYYMDQDMWIAALAMERFLKEKEGPDATILNMLIEEVYKPIGVDHFATGSNYTETGEVGFPYSVWGVLTTIDYLAKAGKLIANKGKAEDGTQILSKELIEDFYTNSDYQFAYWKTTFINDEGAEYHVPTMSGAGGNYVFCMPNGLVGIALGYNSYNFGWSTDQKLTIVEAANKIDPF
jgi:CubicO group peptidase (beta-lactamase class C family)